MSGPSSESRGADNLREKLASNDLEERLVALGELAADVDHPEKVEEELIARITEGPVTRLGRTSLEE